MNFNGLLLRFNGYDKMEGKVERIPRSTCGRESVRRRETGGINIDVSGIQKIHSRSLQECPSDQFIVSSMRETNVSWAEPVFHSKMEILKVNKNLKPDQVFTWGEYDVMYVAQDNSSNTADCSFKVNHFCLLLTYFSRST